MLVQQSNPVTPLTPVSTPPGAHNSDHSPRSSNSSFASNDSLLNTPSKDKNHTTSHQGLSALQRLEFALERNSLFSALLNEAEVAQSKSARLVKPCSSSTSSSTSDSPTIKHENETTVTGMKTHTPASSPDDGINPTSIIFQCPLCSVVSNSRHDFNAHLVTHSQHNSCPKCTFFTDNEDSLREHVQESHDVSDFEVLTDDEVRTPKTNSQGKVKTFKCKQCGYFAVTKMDFWDHTKAHIRSEKMLTCPKCPFVTEYKHHLEYHLRNHFGSKPFQCNKCPYSCVNKSMLNSHLKSHSNIYQYRCADCSYATKYCHSLKLHLRKYNHKPAMVLNPDGTPNPLPIIDVYGTRRGPKIKKSSDQSNSDSNLDLCSPPLAKEKTPKNIKNSRRSQENHKIQVPNGHCTTPPVSPQFESHEIKQEFTLQGHISPPMAQIQIEENKPTHLELVRANNNNLLLQQAQQNTLQIPQVGSINPAALQELLMQQNSVRNQVVNSAALQVQGLLMQHNSTRNQIVNPAASVALQNLMMQNSANKNVMDLAGKSPMELYAAALNQYILSNPTVLHMSSPMDLAKLAEEQRSKMSQIIQQSMAQQSSKDIDHSKMNRVNFESTNINNNNNNTQTPLDLRNPKSLDNNGNEFGFGEDLKKRKRKGKALRYDREKEFRQSFERQESDEVLDFSNNNNKTVNAEINGMNLKKDMDQLETQVCKHCDISFPTVLYNLHMKFHSNDSDPFRCNACGIKTSDKVQFFVHLATASH